MTSTALFQSGVLVPNPLMKAEISSGGFLVNVPFWGDLVSVADPGGVDPNLSNDNPAQLSIPAKISARNQVVRKSFLNSSFGSMLFSGELAGSDPMQRIGIGQGGALPHRAPLIRWHSYLFSVQITGVYLTFRYLHCISNIGCLKCDNDFEIYHQFHRPGPYAASGSGDYRAKTGGEDNPCSGDC